MASGGGRRRGSRRGKAKNKSKYLSLTRHLTKAVDARESKALSLECSPHSALTSPSLEEAVETQPPEDGVDGGEQQQLEGFGLHPEAPATLFAAAPSLTDILGASSSSSAGGGGEESSCGASPDVSPGGTGRFTGEEEDLARRELRGRERWVYYSSSSSSPPSAATTTKTSSSCSSSASTGASARSPLLKLDYEEILAAWAGRGSLYIGGAAAAGHAVPELELDSAFVEVWPSTRHVAAWGAPEMLAGRAEKGRFIKEKEGAAMADGGDLQPSS